jgi:hypothetical protein
LNVTALGPWLEPKPEPLIVTDAPIAPDVGDRLVMLGAVTVNDTPLLAPPPVPPTVTTTLPVAAPVGTTALIVVAFHDVMLAAVVPWKVTVLVPWLEPKLVPVIVTVAPAPPDVGDRLVMLGAACAMGEIKNRDITTQTACNRMSICTPSTSRLREEKIRMSLQMLDLCYAAGARKAAPRVLRWGAGC